MVKNCKMCTILLKSILFVLEIHGCKFYLGADHLIPWGGGYGFFVKKKIVQQILENK